MLKPSGKNGEGLWNEGEVSGYEQGAQKKKGLPLFRETAPGESKRKEKEENQVTCRIPV
jgi:hypothetical protein